jgi:hypothetical protein
VGARGQRGPLVDAGAHGLPPKSTPDDEDGKPSAWLETSGVLTLHGSEAIITGGAEPLVEER